MNQFAYDVAATYRIYPKMSKNRPPVFPEDKFKLAEFCLNSFKNSMGGLRVKLWVILNGCPPEYDDMVKRVWNSEDLVLVHYPGIPSGTTLNEAACILRDQTDAEIVYFADDDYVYLPGQFHLAVDFLKQNADADFLALYDHPDLYTTDLHNLPNETREFAGRQWSTCISTTHTFLARRASLIEIRQLYLDIYKSFKKTITPDLAMWMALTKKRVFNPVKFLRWSVTNRYWAASIFLAWFYCWRQIVFGRRYTLWIPRPSLANHMDAKLPAPSIDWQKEYQSQMAGLKSSAVCSAD